MNKDKEICSTCGLIIEGEPYSGVEGKMMRHKLIEHDMVQFVREFVAEWIKKHE